MSDEISQSGGKHVLIAANPKAGSGRRQSIVKELIDLLTAEDMTVEMMADLRELAQRAAILRENGHLRAVVAAGGDGTVSELVNRCESEVAITVLPLGTENLLAKYLGISPDPRSVFRTLCQGRQVRLDAGRANGRLFALMASCGLDADVVNRLHASRRGNIRHHSYVRPIMASIRSYEYPEMRLYWDDSGTLSQTLSHGPVAAHWAFVFNLPCYARGLPIAPQATGDDGALDLCAFRGGSIWSGMWHLAQVAFARHQQSARCTPARLRRLRIESDRAVPYQLDGDPGGWLPLDIEIVPRRMTLLVPYDWSPPDRGTCHRAAPPKT